MKKGIIGIIIAIIVAGGAYATYHTVSKSNTTPVKTVTTNSVVTTNHQAPVNKTTEKTPVKKAETVDVTRPKTEVTPIKHTEAKPEVKTTNVVNAPVQKPVEVHHVTENTSANVPEHKIIPVNNDVHSTVKKKEAVTTSNYFNEIKALPIYKSNAKYKTAVDQMYQLLDANNLQNSAYMYEICSQPEKYMHVQTEGLMEMVSLKVTKNQALMQKIVNQYGWIQASVLGY